MAADPPPGSPHTDVGGPGFLADPGPFPRPSMADVMSNLRVRLEGARVRGRWMITMPVLRFVEPCLPSPSDRRRPGPTELTKI